MTTEYIVALYGDQTVWHGDDAPDRIPGHRVHEEFGRACADAGHDIRDSAELHHSVSRVVRLRDGRTSVTDGPFAESTEVLAGLYRIATDDVDGLTVLVGELIRGTGEVAEIRESIAPPDGL